jgi:hypothetical protein
MKLPDTYKQIASIAGYISEEAMRMYEDILKTNRAIINQDTTLDEIVPANELEKFGFIFRSTLPTGYELLPTPFEIFLPSLIHRIDWGYPPFNNISLDKKNELKTRLQLINENIPESIPVTRKSTTAPQNIEGNANIDSLVVQLLESAREVRAISAAEWSGNLPLVWSAITERMEKGMLYRRVVPPMTFVAFGWEINWRDIFETGIDLRVSAIHCKSPFYLFTLEDLQSALVFTSSISVNSLPRATYTELHQLNKLLSEMFEDIWHSAISAKILLERLQNVKKDYTSKAYQLCGEIGKLVANKLFDKGIFSTFNEEEQQVLQDFVRKGLSIKSKFSIGLDNYVPNIIPIIETYVNQGGIRDDKNTF